MSTMHAARRVVSILCVVFVVTVFSQASSFAVSAGDIDAGADIALKTLRDVRGGGEVIDKAEGLLVFPGVFKLGMGIGGEYGEGALRINGRTVDYYNIAAASIGLQLGGQKKTVVIAFMTDEALENFRKSMGWKVGADASVAIIALGAGSQISTAVANKPIVGFVFGLKGLMYDVSLNGAKVSKIER